MTRFRWDDPKNYRQHYNMNGRRKGVSAIEEAVMSDQVSDQVIRLLDMLGCGEIGAADLMGKLNLSHRPTFRKNYLEPALTAGVIERTQPESPRSPTQRYRLTKKEKLSSPKGREIVFDRLRP